MKEEPFRLLKEVGCIFQVNEATERGGGALHLELYGTDDQVNTNSITVQDTSFTGNSARWGGAVAICNLSSALQCSFSVLVFPILTCTLVHSIYVESMESMELSF